MAGLHVVVAEQGSVGAGASGGFLGALMPHMPERWNAAKQFQLDGLVSLEAEVADLEEATGISCGYARVGRLIPIARDDLLALAHERGRLAGENWRGANGGYRWEVLPSSPADGWPGNAAAAHGVVFERLSARLDPRATLAALKSDLARRKNVRLIEGDGLSCVDAATATCRLDSGTSVACSHAVISAGAASFAIIAALLGRETADVGRPVKGQAALLACDMPPDMPLVYSDGVYVVPHAGSMVAVGSTSENDFSASRTTDGRLDDLLARARRLCPRVADAPVIERWAGLRPRAAGREPLVGPLPGLPRIIALTGGFKITLGIAHRLAEAALAALDGRDRPELPENFRAEQRLAPPRSPT